MDVLEQFKIIFQNKNIVSLISSALILLFIGIFAGKRKVFEEEAASHLSNIVLTLSIPALSFIAFMNDFDSNILIQGLNLIVWTFILHLIFIGITDFFYIKFKSEEKVSMKISTIFGAVTVLGLPIIQALFGSVGIIYLSLFCIIYRIFLYSYGDEKMSQSNISKNKMKKIFSNPAILATLLGMIVWTSQNYAPQTLVDGESYSIFRIDKTAFFLYKPLFYLSSLCSPLSWLAAGFKLSTLPIIESLKEVKAWYFTLVKTIIFPLITLLLIKILGGLGFFPLGELPASVLIIAMGTPVASVTIAYSIKYKRAPYLTSRCFLISNIFCLLVLPFLLLFIQFAF